MTAFPPFFTINDRPVKVVKHPDGGFDVMALNMQLGDWEPAMEYLDRYWRRDGDIEILTEQQFRQRVSQIRKDLGVPEFD